MSTLQIDDLPAIEIALPRTPYQAWQLLNECQQAERAAQHDLQLAAEAYDGSSTGENLAEYMRCKVTFEAVRGYLLHKLCALEHTGTLEMRAVQAIEHVCDLGYSHEQALSLALACNRLLTEIALRAPDHDEIRRMLDFGISQSVPGSSPVRTLAGENLETETHSLAESAQQSCATG